MGPRKLGRERIVSVIDILLYNLLFTDIAPGLEELLETRVFFGKGGKVRWDESCGAGKGRGNRVVGVEFVCGGVGHCERAGGQ